MTQQAAEVIVMEDSPEAARQVAVTGWVSRQGFFFGDDERTARYDGCTHRKCGDCGQPVVKHWLKCEACRHKDEVARYQALPKKPWDGVTPLALYGGDKYFFDESDLEMYCEDHDVKVQDLLLVFCDPVKPGEISPNDLFADELPEDGEVQDADVLAAVEQLNAALRKAEPFSWLPGKVAAIVEL